MDYWDSDPILKDPQGSMSFALHHSMLRAYKLKRL